MPLFLNARSFIRLLVICLTVIISLNLLFIVLYHNRSLSNQLTTGLYKLFYVDRERNVPSFFNMLLLLVCAILNAYVFLLYKQKRYAGKYYWLILSVAFFFLAFDESVSIHESLTLILPGYGIGGKGAFTFAWVIPYGIAAVLLFIVFLKFLWTLPVRTRLGFMLSGAVFVMGAVGVEMIAAQLYNSNGGDTGTLGFALISTLEETLEMGGLILFIFYILQYTASQIRLVRVADHG
ncbi:MAG: hypothetical protein KF862_04950 [Chitinophagaceae bacterium]|nr:hypothetical protein [Chitinophagaceae bacterium]